MELPLTKYTTRYALTPYRFPAELLYYRRCTPIFTNDTRTDLDLVQRDCSLGFLFVLYESSALVPVFLEST